MSFAPLCRKALSSQQSTWSRDTLQTRSCSAFSGTDFNVCAVLPCVVFDCCVVGLSEDHLPVRILQRAGLSQSVFVPWWPWCCVWKWTRLCSGSGCRDVLMVLSFASRSARGSDVALWCKLMSGVTPLLHRFPYHRLCFAAIVHLVVIFTPQLQISHLPAVGSDPLKNHDVKHTA